MSTDQYPEVSGDDSSLVPPQGHPQSEWPKKIRTLSAGELDRLTIDGAGRFYWDGHLVNYQAPHPQATEARMEQPAMAEAHLEPMMGRSPDSAAVDLDALEILDRAALELSVSDRRPAEEPVTLAPEAVPNAAPVDPVAAMEEYLAETPAVQAVALAAPVTVQPVAEVAVPVAVPVLETPTIDPALVLQQPRHLELVEHAPARADKVRFTLNGGQSLALLLVVFSLMIGAAGLAAQGWVAAHEWGCRTGAIKSYCPAPPPKAPAAADLPA